LKPKEIEEEVEGFSVRHTECNGGKGDIFMATKVPRQCTLVLLVNVGWRRGKAFRSEEGKDEKWSKKRS
jgi:hypothetical protein